MGRGALWTTVHGVTKTWTLLSNWACICSRFSGISWGSSKEVGGSNSRVAEKLQIASCNALAEKPECSSAWFLLFLHFEASDYSPPPQLLPWPIRPDLICVLNNGILAGFFSDVLCCQVWEELIWLSNFPSLVQVFILFGSNTSYVNIS